MTRYGQSRRLSRAPRMTAQIFVWQLGCVGLWKAFPEAVPRATMQILEIERPTATGHRLNLLPLDLWISAREYRGLVACSPTPYTLHYTQKKNCPTGECTPSAETARQLTAATASPTSCSTKRPGGARPPQQYQYLYAEESKRPRGWQWRRRTQTCSSQHPARHRSV